MHLRLIGVCVVCLGLFILAMYRAEARWKPEYAQNSPTIQKWFSSQRNEAGEWCCSEADGHRYYGDYTPHPDGSVTVDGETIPKEKVLRGPNPTGTAIWWFLDVGGERHTYCFALGGGV